MGFPLEIALRYMRSKKRVFISVGTMFAVLGVALGTAALATVLSVTGGFRAQFREKVLGVNAHVLVLKYSSEFPEYRDVVSKVEKMPEVVGAGPFIINPMMLTHAGRTATGVLVKGVDPERMRQVLDLPRHMVEGSLDGMRLPGATPPKPRSPEVHTILPSTSPDDEEDEASDVDILELIRERERGLAKGADEPKKQDELALPPQNDAQPALEEKPLLPVEVPDGAPVGNVVPEGGYDSVLPDDDDLPEEVSPDPCTKNDASLPGIVVGITLKKNLGAELGDCIQVTSPTIGYSYSRGVVRPPVAKQFRVTGVFEAGFDQYDSKLAYTDLYEAQAFYDSGDTVTGVEMKIKDIDAAKQVSLDLADALKHDPDLKNGALYNTMDWEELNHGLFTALRIQQVLMSLVLALIILVAAFTVIATLIMVVLDKKKEIAVLKAMGATNWEILRSFLYQGIIIGFAGASGGLVLGYVVCRWILIYGFPLDPKVYFISQLPVQMQVDNFTWTGIFAVLVCLGATVWPALHAARLRPAEAFREQGR
jgi:lipoprotein-releasing system permease protein